MKERNEVSKLFQEEITGIFLVALKDLVVKVGLTYRWVIIT